MEFIKLNSGEYEVIQQGKVIGWLYRATTPVPAFTGGKVKNRMISEWRLELVDLSVKAMPMEDTGSICAWENWGWRLPKSSEAKAWVEEVLKKLKR